MAHDTSTDYMGRVDALREERKLNTTALATRAGLSSAALRKMRGRGGGGTADTLCRLAMALGVSMQYLWTGREYTDSAH